MAASDKILKYLSTMPFILLPKILRMEAITKNLKALPAKAEIIIAQIFILNKPAAIVITLNGMGVKAAVKTVRKTFSEYLCPMASTVEVRL